MIARQHVDALIFDLDGTLFDHEGASREALIKQVDTSGRSRGRLDVHSLVSRWGALEALHFTRYLDGEISFEEQRAARVRDFEAMIPGLLADVEPLEWFNGYLKEYERAWAPYPEVASTLDRIARDFPDLATAVLTNGQFDQQVRKLGRLSLSPMPLFASSVIGWAKPDARAFLYTCEALGVKADRAMYVGDRLEIDAAPAMDAGMLGVWIDRRRARDLSAQPPRIASLVDLCDLIPPPVCR